jgi:hypothetical protein
MNTESYKLLKKAVLIFSLLFLFVNSEHNSLAQEVPTQDPVTVSTKVVARVNLYNAKIISQQEGFFELSFDVANSGDVQPGLNYKVQLIKKDGEKGIVWDEKKYPDEISLDALGLISRQVEYKVPEYFKGDYEIWIVLENASGMMLSKIKSGNISLDGNEQFVEVNPSSCYLMIEGSDTKFLLRQGIDVKENENITGYCKIVNHFSNDLVLTPYVENHYRETSGPLVGSAMINQSSISIGAGETREISFPIPKAEDPQAYDAVVQFNSEGKAVSNQVSFHYVLRGESATIQNFRLDKNYYLEGENAQATLDWSPSAESFFGARFGTNKSQKNIMVQMSIKDEKDVQCADVWENKVGISESQLQIAVPIKENCINPKVEVILKSLSGKVLDSEVYNIKSKDFEEKIRQTKEGEVENIKKLGTKETATRSAAIIVLALALILLILNRTWHLIQKRMLTKKYFFFVFLFSVFSLSSFVSAERARADSLNVEFTWQQLLCLDSEYCMGGADELKNCNCYKYCIIGGCSSSTGCGHFDEGGEVLDCASKESNTTGVSYNVYLENPAGLDSLNQPVYNPPGNPFSTITASGDFYSGSCLNQYMLGTRTYRLNANQQSIPLNKTLFNSGTVPFANRFNEFTPSGSQNFTAEATPGTYTMLFRAFFQGYIKNNTYAPPNLANSTYPFTYRVNDVPIAAINPSGNINVINGQSQSFSGAGSTENTGVIDTYEWHQGNCAGAVLSSSSNPLFNKTFSGVGTTSVISLRVRDQYGLWSTNCPSTTVTVVPSNPPTASITSALPASAPVNSAISFVGVGYTGSGGNIGIGTSAAFKWLEGDCATGIDLGVPTNYFSPPNAYPATSNISKSFSIAGSHTISLMVRDDSGNWSTNCPSVSVTITPVASDIWTCGPAENNSSFCTVPIKTDITLCTRNSFGQGSDNDPQLSPTGDTFTWTCNSGALSCSAVKHCISDSVWSEIQN